MHWEQSIERPPRRAEGMVSPWVEISAWMLAFAILLAAQCIPEHVTPGGGSAQTVDARRP